MGSMNILRIIDHAYQLQPDWSHTLFAKCLNSPEVPSLPTVIALGEGYFGARQMTTGPYRLGCHAGWLLLNDGVMLMHACRSCVCCCCLGPVALELCTCLGLNCLCRSYLPHVFCMQFVIKGLRLSGTCERRMAESQRVLYSKSKGSNTTRQ